MPSPSSPKVPRPKLTPTAPDSPLTPLEVISRQAAEVRDAAASLTDRIKQFQSYIGSIPGRVETDHYVHLAGNEGIVLRLHRQGKEWVLSFCIHINHGLRQGFLPIFEEQPEFKLLIDAPLRTKVAAVEAFPSFLDAMVKSQTSLVNSLKASTEEFDQFFSQLPKMEKEGK
jgi:hypothetical protein